MTPVPSLQQWPRGPVNELYYAARYGAASRTAAVLSSGSCDINEGDPVGITPLMMAAEYGHASVIKILLDRRIQRVYTG